MFDFLIGRKRSLKDRQVKVSFRKLKAQIYWPTTDQKVRGSNPCGRTIDSFEFKNLQFLNSTNMTKAKAARNKFFEFNW